MPDWSLQQIVFLVCVGLFTLAAAVCDFRERKIPNMLTLPMFGVGWVYQLSFFGGAGLLDGLLAFMAGFGTLFVLWMIGGGGGGDVKLMGALAVWLGFQLTLLVLIASTLCVITGSLLVVVGGVIRRVHTTTKDAGESPQSNETSKRTPNGETITPRGQRRLMAYAIPVAVATWLVMFWKLPLM